MAKITFFFSLFSTLHTKLSRFTNHTVQKFFKVQILWIGISWYIHFIFLDDKKNQKSMFFFVQSGSILMVHPYSCSSHAGQDSKNLTAVTLARIDNICWYCSQLIMLIKKKRCFLHTEATFPIGAVLRHSVKRKRKKNWNLVWKSQRDPCVGFL